MARQMEAVHRDHSSKEPGGDGESKAVASENSSSEVDRETGGERKGRKSETIMRESGQEALEVN
jgi:hypothetical protein